MASGATPTAVKVRLAAPAAKVRPAGAPLLPPGEPRPGARRPRRFGEGVGQGTLGGFGQGRGVGREGMHANWPPPPLVSAVSSPRRTWASRLEKGRGAEFRPRSNPSLALLLSREMGPAVVAVCLQPVRLSRRALRDSSFGCGNALSAAHVAGLHARSFASFRLFFFLQTEDFPRSFPLH